MPGNPSTPTAASGSTAADIDPKALALQTAERLDSEAYYEDHVAIALTREEARALAAFLREAVEGAEDGWAQAKRNGERGYVTNCLLWHRGEDPAHFYAYEDGPVIACLDRFAILPEEIIRQAIKSPKAFAEQMSDWLNALAPIPTPPARIEDSEEPSHERR